MFYGRIDILLSGAKPYELVRDDSLQFAFLDGGFGNIGDVVYNSAICPRVSSSYRSHFKNKFFSNRQKQTQQSQQATEWIKKAQADDRQIRFWAMPDRRRVWLWHWQAGTDWLNVDKIRKFNRYYRQKLKKNSIN